MSDRNLDPEVKINPEDVETAKIVRDAGNQFDQATKKPGKTDMLRRAMDSLSPDHVPDLVPDPNKK